MDPTDAAGDLDGPDGQRRSFGRPAPTAQVIRTPCTDSPGQSDAPGGRPRSFGRHGRTAQVIRTPRADGPGQSDAPGGRPRSFGRPAPIAQVIRTPRADSPGQNNPGHMNAAGRWLDLLGLSVRMTCSGRRGSQIRSIGRVYFAQQVIWTGREDAAGYLDAWGCSPGHLVASG